MARKSLFRKSLFKKKRTKRRISRFKKKRTKRRTKRRRKRSRSRKRVRGYRLRKQKGGLRVSGNWLTIDEIKADDVCVFCEKSVFNPRTVEETVYMLTCCVGDDGEGFLAHTGCIKKKCEDDGGECSQCGDYFTGACVDIHNHYNPEEDAEESPIKINEGLQYYNPSLPTAQAPMPGGSRRRNKRKN